MQRLVVGVRGKDTLLEFDHGETLIEPRMQTDLKVLNDLLAGVRDEDLGMALRLMLDVVFEMEDTPVAGRRV